MDKRSFFAVTQGSSARWSSLGLKSEENKHMESKSSSAMIDSHNESHSRIEIIVENLWRMLGIKKVLGK